MLIQPGIGYLNTLKVPSPGHKIKSLQPYKRPTGSGSSWYLKEDIRGQGLCQLAFLGWHNMPNLPAWIEWVETTGKRQSLRKHGPKPWKALKVVTTTLNYTQINIGNWSSNDTYVKYLIFFAIGAAISVEASGCSSRTAPHRAHCSNPDERLQGYEWLWPNFTNFLLHFS